MPVNKALDGPAEGTILRQKMNRGAKIMHIEKDKSIGLHVSLPSKNIGVRRNKYRCNAKNPNEMGDFLGQNACPKGVARKNVSRIVLRTSRESV
jgi:hypothetical protein